MDMIKKMHRRFLLLATLAVFIIVTAALSIINGMIYFVVHDEIHTVMESISQNGGVITTRGQSSSWLNDGSWSGEAPEFTYQTRYFSVLLDADGTAKVTNLNHIAAFSAEEAVESAVRAVKSGEEEGFFHKNRGCYSYRVSQTENGDALVVILDCTRDIAAVKAFFKYSCLFGLLGILLFVGILTILSKTAIRPFVRNVENQKRFITNASHELKTPVAIISANAEAMELISGKNEWTGNILAQVKRLSLLINDLVLLSKIGESSEKDITLSDTDLSSAALLSADGFKQMILDSGKKIELDIESAIHGLVEPKLFSEIVNILMDNAVKYCDDGGTITISLHKKKNGKGKILAVSNHYKDGKAEDYEKFFERFYRGDTSHNSKKAGYGIGLSMARDMATLMKGRLGVTYKDGVITFFLEVKE
jgi:two-component system, OmpR family, sensor histidine kinase CiaH